MSDGIPGALRSVVRDGMRIDWDVPIPLRDGTVLMSDVFRPTEGDGFPVIASHGPYAKGLTFAAGYPGPWRRLTTEFDDALEGSSGRYAAWEVLDPEQWVPHGYCLVRVDSRGAGRSPGHIDVWSPQEALDFYDCIEWIGVQPWCNGRVGLSGISYYAKNQWQVAELRPPHLAAICPWEGSNDYYREMSRHGGIHNAFLPDWYRRMGTIQYGLGSRGFTNPESGLQASGDVDLTDEQLADNRRDLAAEILEHVLADEWYEKRTAKVDRIEVPLLSAANWGGLGNHQRGNFTAWADAGSAQKWLEVHGGTHWSEYYTGYGRRIQRRFFDWFLKGEGDWLDQPLVLLNVRHPGGKYVPRAEQEWPLARTRWQRTFLDAADCTMRVDEPMTQASITYAAFGDGVHFDTPTLEQETEITGPLAARLWISSSATDADLFLVLRAFDPDGNEVLFEGANDPRTPLSQGWLRASHRAIDPARSKPERPRHPHDRAEPLVPGEVYPVDVEIWPTCIVLPQGYRLRLSVLGRDFDHGLGAVDVGGRQMSGSGPFRHHHPLDRPTDVFDNEVTVHTGPGRESWLLLPIIAGEVGAH